MRIRRKEDSAIAMKTHVVMPRSDVVGSLLRPSYLREMRQAVCEGRASTAELRAAEDRAVREAVALQEAAGLNVITDGEYRRYSWIATIPIREDRSYHAPLSGYQFLPANAGWYGLWREPDGRRAQISVTSRPFITKPLRVERDIVTEEYSFLKANTHARTKYTIPAPSWHRIFWHPEHSRAAYPTPEDFLHAIAHYLRQEVVEKLIALGCDYIQLDAPNYAQWHVDPDNRATFEAWGHDMAAELVADVEIDNTVFAVLPALHAPSTSAVGTVPRDGGSRTAVMSGSPVKCSPGSVTSTGCCWSMTRRGQGTSVRFAMSCRSMPSYSD